MLLLIELLLCARLCDRSFRTRFSKAFPAASEDFLLRFHSGRNWASRGDTTCPRHQARKQQSRGSNPTAPTGAATFLTSSWCHRSPAGRPTPLWASLFHVIKMIWNLRKSCQEPQNIEERKCRPAVDVMWVCEGQREAGRG